MDTEGLTSIKLGARTWDCSTRFEISADLTRVLSVVLHPNCQKPRLGNAVSNSTALPLLQKPNFRLSLHAVESLSSHVLGSSPFAVQQAVPACPMSSQTG